MSEDIKAQLKLLRDLQEIVLIRDENHEVGGGSRIDELNDRIDAIKAKLVPNIRAVYERLYKRNHVALAGVTNGNCAACGMAVPISLIQQVKSGAHLTTCSSCGRILFSDEELARNTTPPVDRDEIKVGMSRFSDAALMIADLKGTTKVDVISELAERMQKLGCIDNADNLVAMAMEREEILGTGTDGDVAFPHVRGVEGGGLTMAVGVSKAGLKWDGLTVHLVVLSAIPVAVSAFYLRLMGGLTAAFAKSGAMDQLVKAADGAALWKTLCKLTKSEIR